MWITFYSFLKVVCVNQLFKNVNLELVYIDGTLAQTIECDANNDYVMSSRHVRTRSLFMWITFCFYAVIFVS